MLVRINFNLSQKFSYNNIIYNFIYVIVFFFFLSYIQFLLVTFQKSCVEIMAQNVRDPI